MKHDSPTYVGPLEPFEFAVDEHVQENYLEALEDNHMRYLLSHQGRPPLAHPGILLSHSNATRSPSFSGPNTHWIHFREQARFCAPARLHDRLIVRWWIEAHEPWLGRTLTRVACKIVRCGGELILERTMWGFRSSRERPLPPMQARAPRQEPFAPRSPQPLNPADWEIRGRCKQLTSERIRLFSGRGPQNLHTSDEVARDAGLPAAIGSAAQGMGYLCEYMIDGFGEEWLSSGSWVLTFRKPMFAGDELSPLGKLRNAEPTERGAHCTIDLRLMNHHGLATAQGTATGHCILSTQAALRGQARQGTTSGTERG